MISPHHYHPTNGVRPSDSIGSDPLIPKIRYFLRHASHVLSGSGGLSPAIAAAAAANASFTARTTAVLGRR